MQTLETRATVRASDFAPFLRVRSVSKRFGDHEVLRNLDLTVQAGEMVAIVGKSGCGKSTLLRLLTGLEKPSDGKISIDSKPLNGRNRPARLMFQEPALLPWNTVLENVALAASDRSRPRESALEALRQVGLAHRARDWPAILSGGQKQRIALARALASDATLILFDEPLGALDALTRLEMQNLIEKLWQERGFTAILVTHDVEEAVALADRVLLMQHGEFGSESVTSLPRPRDRASEQFATLKAEILSRVLGQE
ncbi:MAG TPA: ABC transporter ATP-binding protein [Chthoniobacterales bacterium]|nr:ABC transporter ATP-binding protein [Chthoniobacterales bacterium]